MASLTIVKGPYTSPVGEGFKLLVVPCNILGIVDMPHLVEIIEKYPSIKEDYSLDAAYHNTLGEVGSFHETLEHISDFYVMDQITPDLFGNPLIHADVFEKCAQSLYSTRLTSGEYSVHYPLIRKEENWDIIKDILTQVFVDNGISVYAYDNNY